MTGRNFAGVIQILILVALLPCALLHAQSIVTGAIDLSEYPNVSMPIIVLDAAGRVLPQPLVDDIKLEENGSEVPIDALECSATEAMGLSSVLMIDVSESMQAEYLGLAQSAARTWLGMLDFNTSECALATFNDQNRIHADFASSRVEIENALNLLSAGGNTDFDAALLDPKAAALDLVATGTSEQIVILVTDGDAAGNEAEMLSRLAGSGIRVYSVLFGIEVPGILQNIADASGGLTFANVNSALEARSAFAQIFMHASSGTPCVLRWTAQADCRLDREIKLQYQNAEAVDLSYTAEAQFLPLIRINPGLQDLGSVAVGSAESFNITLFAENQSREVTDILTDDPALTISSFGGTAPPFSMAPGTQRTLELEYRAADLLRRYINIQVVSNSCRAVRSTVIVGTEGETLNADVRILHPNGGEVFALGDEVQILWEGSAAFGNCNLELSADGGANWQQAGTTQNTDNLLWRANNPAGTEWLARVSAMTLPNPDRNWVWSSQGRDAGQIHDIEIVDDGRIYVSGIFDGDLDLGDGFFLNGNGVRGIFIAVFSPLGRVLGARAFPGNPGVHSVSITSAADGSIYSLSSFRDSFIADGVNYDSRGLFDIALGKFVADLSTLNIQTFGSTRSDIAGDLHLTAGGDVIIVGATGGPIAEFNQTENIMGSDAAVIFSLDAAGSLNWFRSVDGVGLSSTALDIFTRVEITDAGDIIAAGTVSPNAQFDGRTLTHSGTGADLLVTSYSLLGDEQRARAFGSEALVLASDVVATERGDFVVCGHFRGSSLRSNSVNITADGIQNSFVISFDQLFSVNWSHAFGNVTAKQPRLIYDAAADELTVGLAYTRQLEVAEFTLIDGGGAEDGVFGDIAIIRLAASSSQVLDATSYGGIKIDEPTALARSSDGALLTAGIFEGPISLGGANLQPAGRQSMFLWQLAQATLLARDVSDATWTVAAPTFEIADADFGNCPVGGFCERRFTAMLNNSALIDIELQVAEFAGTDASAFELVAPSMPMLIPAGTSRALELRFRPLREGVHAAELTFYTSGFESSQTASLSGSGVIQPLQVETTVIDFGEVTLGQRRTLSELVLLNVSAAAVTIDALGLAGPDIQQFEVEVPALPVSIAAGESLNLTMQFEPVRPGRASSAIIVRSSNGMHEYEIGMFGSGVKAGIELWVEDATSAAGQEVEIVIGARHTFEFPDETAIQINAILDVNAFMLFPGAAEIIGTVNSGRREIPLTLSIPATAGVYELQRLRFTAMLGPLVESEMRLRVAENETPSLDLELSDGIFRLHDFCEVGGNRLFSQGTAGLGIKNVVFDQPSASLKVLLEFSGRDHADLKLYSSLGDCVGNYYDAPMQAGEFELSADVKSLAQGMYFLVLRVGQFQYSQAVLIGR